MPEAMRADSRIRFKSEDGPNIDSITLNMNGNLRTKTMTPNSIPSTHLLPGQEELLVARGWYWGSQANRRSLLHPGNKTSTPNRELSRLFGQIK